MASTSGTTGVAYRSTGYSTLAAWQASNGSAFGQNSFDLDPLFEDVASGNLLPYEAAINNGGNDLTGVTTDIVGEIRNALTPTPGAFEITTVLPVTLIHLSAARQSNDVRLDWTTVNEFNNAGFDVERSLDGTRFTKVGFVSTRALNGNNSGKLNYDFLDVNAPTATVFYRLKQMDKDGTSELSNVVVMTKIGVDKLDIISVYPNPVTATVNDLKVQMESPDQTRVVFVVTDVTGKVLKQQTEMLRVGNNIFNIHIHNLSSGSYFVKAICADGCETTVRKFIKQ
jgi:hypothetical protein